MTANQKNLLLLIATSSALVIACGTGNSSDVKQSTIVQDYAVSYSERDQLVQASAGFRYDSSFGSSLRLTENSSISFDAQPMSYQDVLNSGSYVSQFAVEPTADKIFEFRYVNNDGEVFLVPAQIPAATRAIPNQDWEHVDASGDLRLRLQGEPLREYESIELCLESKPRSASEGPMVRECLTTDDSMLLTFYSDVLSRFPVDSKLELSLVRLGNRPQENAQISLLERYEAEPMTIVLRNRGSF